MAVPGRGRKTVKKSLNAWSAPGDLGFAEMFSALSAAGFDGVELNVDAPGAGAHSLSVETTRAELSQIRDMAEESGLEISGISTSLGGKSGSDDPRELDFQRELLRKQLEFAEFFGADGVLTVPGGMSERVSLLRAHENSLAFFAGLKGEIEEIGVPVGVENVWNGFFTSPFHMRDFIDAVGSDRVGAYLDVGNMLEFSSPEPWIEILGERIKKVHVKDFKRCRGNFSGGTFVNLLEGDANWPGIMRELRKAGYGGHLTAELEITRHRPEYLYNITSAALDIILAL